jgi:hypothetical protein
MTTFQVDLASNISRPDAISNLSDGGQGSEGSEDFDEEFGDLDDDEFAKDRVISRRERRVSTTIPVTVVADPPDVKILCINVHGIIVVWLLPSFTRNRR